MSTIDNVMVLHEKVTIHGTCSTDFTPVRGSLSFVDLDARMSIGFVPNRWISGPFEIFRNSNIVRAAYDALARNR